MSKAVRVAALGFVATLALWDATAGAQDRAEGAAQLHTLVKGLTVTPRVLVIGARPEDDDGQLLAWLVRGRMVETGFLSLTRGESAPNVIGTESGATLGAIRTQELLAARRIDGAEQFFTRAFDFGFSRNVVETFKRWPHDSVLGDVVTIVRSFRPHVIVAAVTEGFPGNDGQEQALATLARQAYDAAADTVAFPARRYGVAWSPLKLYMNGNGLEIDPTEHDPVLGKTYNDVALESRAMRRTEGFEGAVLDRAGRVRLRRVASRVNDSTLPVNEKSLFDGIDTNFTRLVPNAPSELHEIIPLIVTYADSARIALDLERPDRVLSHVSHVAELAMSARSRTPYCAHPAVDATAPAGPVPRCEPRLLDFDASIDLVRRRATEAFMLAAGISFDVALDRELVADGDTAVATITMYNYGRLPVTLGDVTVFGSPVHSKPPLVVPPDSSVRVFRSVAGLVTQQPWWLGKREAGLFPSSRESVDGIERPEDVPELLSVPGIAVPEAMRRTTDVSVSVTVNGMTVSGSVGPILRRTADAQLGIQDRTVGGTPPVTMEFDHPLEWIPAHKQVDRPLRIAVRSFSDAPQTFAFKVFLKAKGVHLDSLPASLTLAPHEQRNVFVRLRGVIDTGRFEFGVYGVPIKPGTVPGRVAMTREQWTTAFQTVQYPYLPPIRLFHSSGMWLRGVDIAVPPLIGVIYVKGIPDDLNSALKQVGISTFVVPAEDLLSTDLSRVTTVVLGRAAYEMHPELVAQNGRLMDFVRQGGRLVIQQGGFATVSTRVLPYPVSLQRLDPERVSTPTAPVSILERTSRFMTWPNAIQSDDWIGWVSDRALFVPTTADPRYTTLIETHDPEQPENRNTILVARFGKGTLVYTTLTFDQQIQGGVPGALRLFVNLLSTPTAAKP